MKVELVIHTTCDIEFELIEEGTGRVILERGFLAVSEGNDEAEAAAKRRVRRWCENHGHELVGEVWS
jgi:hypothetical protein